MSVPTLSNKPENIDLLVLPPGEKKALCQDPQVTFAAYRQPHPLQNTIEITIKPKGYAGVKLLSDNVNSLLSDVSQLRETFKKKVQRYKDKSVYYADE